MREFAFELALCAAIEDGERLVGRQLGTGVHSRRIADVVLADPGPTFSERAALTPETIPSAAIESAVGPGRARFWKDVFDCHPETAREATERAVECGFFERERRGGRTYVRQTARYPDDWFDTLVGIENKPDLGRPGDLETQLLIDAKLALLDEVVLATTSHVTGAHLNRIPDSVGVWEFDPETGERTVVREAEQLPTREIGLEVIERTPARTDVRMVGPARKATQRRRLAERVYGKGWRMFEYPGCAKARADEAGLPQCSWAGRPVDAATECGPACPGYEPGDSATADRRSLRAARTPWEPEPAGRSRRQAGLDSF